ncbi:MAG: hypothetical protein ABI832_19785, partial [bacterium]
MAFFSAHTAYDANLINFHAFFGPGHTALHLPSQSAGTDSVSAFYLVGSYEVAAGQLALDDLWTIPAGANSGITFAGTGLAATAKGVPTDGLISFLTVSSNGQPSFDAYGFSITGTSFAGAATSTSNSDDLGVMAAILQDNDLILLSAADDVIYTNTGNDFVVDSGGANYINGQFGNDFILSGSGDDTVVGSDGNDILMDAGGDNHLSGGRGRDIIMSGIGADTVSGGAGRDTFVFSSGGGRDTVSDFNTGQDKILIFGPVFNLQGRLIPMAPGPNMWWGGLA